MPSTTQYYTSDGIKKGVPFRNASGFHTDEVDALVEKIKVETDPAKRKALVVEFQKITTVECAVLPLVELESITLASTKVQNHSNDPNFLAASWYDIWLASLAARGSGARRHQSCCQPFSDHDRQMSDASSAALPLPTLPRMTGEEQRGHGC